MMVGSSSRGLRHFMDILGFVDLGYGRRNFTWTNGRSELACIRERLDRSIANVPWCLHFPNAGVKHFSVTNSDHIPLILNLFGSEALVAKGFKFEKFWVWEDYCFGLVADTWHQYREGSPAWVLFSKIRAVREALRLWNKNVFGDIHLTIKLVKEQLCRFQEAEPTPQNLWQEKCLLLDLDEQLHHEEVLWKQKSRVAWLSSSDLNTNFFHASTVIRRCRNQIAELKNQGREWIFGHSTIGRELVDFYTSLYRSNQPDIPLELKILISPVITEEENNLLIMVPDGKEIWEVL